MHRLTRPVSLNLPKNRNKTRCKLSRAMSDGSQVRIDNGASLTPSSASLAPENRAVL